MKAPSKKTLPHVRKLAFQLIRHHFPRKKISITPLGGGLTNFVFAVNAGKEELVVRISEQLESLNFFLKEQWSVARAREKKIPVPEILEVGNSVIPLPYMILSKVSGEVAIDHPERKNILFEMGKLAAKIHKIKTTGYGQFFDWSSNTLSKNITWKDYIYGELDANSRLEILKKNRMLSAGSLQRATAEIKKISSWTNEPSLQHGDMRLKNIVVDKKGKITAVLDWEECISAIGPSWDLSIALHDLPLEGQQRFVEGYGLSHSELIRTMKTMKVFNLLNYAPVIQLLVQEKNTAQVEWYRARMRGAFDLFSI